MKTSRHVISERRAFWKAIGTIAWASLFCGGFIAYHTHMFVVAWHDGYFLLRLATMLMNTVAAACFYLAWRLWRRPTVRSAPGTQLERIAKFLWPPKTYDRIFAPTIADLRFEYQEALHKGETWHCRWIWVRGHISFWAACSEWMVHSLRHIWTAAK